MYHVIIGNDSEIQNISFILTNYMVQVFLEKMENMILNSACCNTLRTPVTVVSVKCK